MDKQEMSCPRCGKAFSDEDIDKNPQDYFECAICHAIQHETCRHLYTEDSQEIIEVQWIDSSKYEGRQNKKDFEKWIDTDDMKCKSVGYLIAVSDTSITLAMSETEDNYADGLNIPKSAITEMRLITFGKAPVENK